MGITGKNGVTYLFCYGNATLDFANNRTPHILVMLQKMALCFNNHRNNGSYVRTMAQCNNHKQTKAEHRKREYKDIDF